MRFLCACLLPVMLPAQTEVVTGTATYRERMATPPGSVFQVTLENVSRADAPATVIASVRQENPGQPPFRFSISYDAAKIDRAQTYIVRARLTHEGRLLFTSDRAIPVLTGGGGNPVDIIMVRAASLLGALPATYQGLLPCADCPGITHTLELMPDGSFILRLAYSGRGQGKAIDSIGRWTYTSGSSQIVLHGRSSTRYAIKPGGVLRQLDSEGREIESKLNYDLRRTASVPPLEPNLTGLRGMFRYFADSATFTECVSGRRFPVAMEAAFKELESAYLKARPESGAELLVTLDGRIALRPSMEGAGRVRTLIIEGNPGVWPGETCGTPLATAELRETYWKLTRLDGEPIIVRAGVREPHLIFHSAGSRVTGFGGCNNLTGTYTASGSDGLTFGPMAATRMACPPGADREAELLQALPRVRHWKIDGQHLEFSDADGRFIARFEARAL